MSKTASDSLFNLVKSLTASEVKHYKSSALKGKKLETNFSRLFEAMLSMEHFDDELLYSSIKKHSSTRKSYNSQKEQLYSSILKSMLHYRLLDPGNVDTRLNDDIQVIHFLITKNLLSDALKQLDRAKELAQLNERALHLCHISRLEQQILISDNSAESILRRENAKKEAEENLRILDGYLKVMHIEQLMQPYLQGDLYSKKDNKKTLAFAKSILSDPVFKTDIVEKSAEAALILLYAQDLLFKAQQIARGPVTKIDWKSSFHIYHALHHKLKQGSKFSVIQSLPGRYIIFLNNYLIAAINTATEKGETALVEALSISIKNENIRLNRDAIAFQFSLQAANQRASEVVFDKTLNRFLKGFENDENRIFPVILMGIYNYLAIGYFIHGRWKESERVFKKAISFNERHPHTRSDIAQVARIMLAIIAYEKNSRSGLYETIKNVEPSLRADEKLVQFYTTVFDFLKKSVRGLAATRELKAFVRKLKQLHELDSKPFIFFEFIEWFESRLGGETYHQRIRKLNSIPEQSTNNSALFP